MNELAEQHDALARYIDALLPRVAPVEAPAEESRVSEGIDIHRRDFMLMQVRDVRLALDAARVKSVMPFPADGVDYRDGVPSRLRPMGCAAPVPIVALRRVIFPEGHAAREDCSPYRYLIVLWGPSVALACDDIGEVVAASGDDVQWREARATRPWLAGMLRPFKCAVIEVSAEAEGAH